MPRSERLLDPSAGPVQEFASALRAVREKAGNPTYLKMARATGRSRTALSEAAGGDHLPTWETVEAYLTACGESPREWLERWESVRGKLGQDRLATGPKAEVVAAVSQQPPVKRPTNERLLTRRGLLMGTGVILVAVAAVLVGTELGRGQTNQKSVVPPDGTTTVYVQNKVASGPTGFYEDSTPVYLSTKMQPMCARDGCKVHGTEMWSGVPLEALCQAQGRSLTNANTHSVGIQSNSNAVTSSRWYKVKTSDGVVGYIAEVYLTPSSRGGLGLPQCPPE